MAGSCRAWAEIDLKAIRHNTAVIQRRVGPQVGIMAVVKADAYGHGAIPIARATLAAGAVRLAVGTLDEALELREAGIECPVEILGAILPGEIGPALRHRITPTVHCQAIIGDLARRAREQDQPVPVHLNVDTGMMRLGVLPNEALETIEQIEATPSLKLEGLMTHFPVPNDPEDEQTGLQVAMFRMLSQKVAAKGIRLRYRHAASSQAIFAIPGSHGNLVRPGIGLLGVDPGTLKHNGALLKPALSLRTRIVHLKSVPTGTPISYGRLYTTEKPTRIATLPIGYDDGFPLKINEGGEVLIRGRRAPVVGRVTMDYVMVDVGHIPGVKLGDTVTLVGSDGSERIGVEEIANTVGTIPYAITCGLGRRVRRIYREAGGTKHDATALAQTYASPHSSGSFRFCA